MTSERLQAALQTVQDNVTVEDLTSLLTHTEQQMITSLPASNKRSQDAAEYTLEVKSLFARIVAALLDDNTTVVNIGIETAPMSVALQTFLASGATDDLPAAVSYTIPSAEPLMSAMSTAGGARLRALRKRLSEIQDGAERPKIRLSGGIILRAGMGERIGERHASACRYQNEVLEGSRRSARRTHFWPREGDIVVAGIIPSLVGSVWGDSGMGSGMAVDHHARHLSLRVPVLHTSARVPKLRRRSDRRTATANHL